MSDIYRPLVVEATRSVFETMLGTTVSPLEPIVGTAEQLGQEISGIIGLSGQGQGMLALSLTLEGALSATHSMLGIRPTHIDGNVADTVGELTNMVAGVVKGRLGHLNLNMGLPSVITGNSHCIVFPSEVVPLCVPFDSPWGRVLVEFGMVEQVLRQKVVLQQWHEVA